MHEQKYLAELSRLLGFMSSWDRQSVIEHFKDRFDAALDRDALIKEMGSPTYVAIELARGYVPSPRPEGWKSPDSNSSEDSDSPVFSNADSLTEVMSEDNADQNRVRFRPAGLLFFILLVLLIGVPVGVILLLPGLFILAAGIALILVTVRMGSYAFRQLALLSDKLMVGGVLCVAAGLGLVFAWLGLYLCIRLPGAWIRHVLAPLGRKLCWYREASEV